MPTVKNPPEQSFSSLFSLRAPRAVPVLREIVDWAIELIEQDTDSNGTLGHAWDVYTGFRFANVTDADDVRNYWDGARKRLVGLLIGNRDYADMTDDLVLSVENRSRQLNLKSVREHLILNKQGVILVTPKGATGVQRDRFYKALDLAEIAMVYRAFIDDVYLARRNAHSEFLDYVFTIAKAWIGSPAAVLGRSYTNTLHWQVLSSEFGLPERLALLEQENPWLLRDVFKRSEYYAQLSSDWWSAESFAATWADRSEQEARSALSFVDGSTVRASILADLHEAERSLAAHNYKAAIVLAGTVVEAVLLILLEQSRRVPPEALHEGSLAYYVDRAREHGLLRDSSLLGMVDEALRDWRNLMQPDLSMRTRAVLDEHRARIALSAAHALINDLSGPH